MACVLICYEKQDGTMKQAKPRIVEVADRSYQPSCAELREDLRLKGPFEKAMKALVRPVKARKVMPAKC